ncbi:hypothetical protein GKQ23_13540 [Erwinia sp. E602]|uniref:tail fiber assembly protein n=1 Tax=Erwinia sp. E602 TaxID=2675378 RepID=UPI001BA91617|nr:tail fiber assembly protein [Erwinia sp. E602]QUG77928.1 hypothetical protein GKQ23_13540 [Erwinia sp. E602]
MTFEMTEEEQTVRVFNFNFQTFEFVGAEELIIPPYTGLPASCTQLLPPDEIPAGRVALFDVENQSWSFAEDHRGEMVYSQETGDSVLITELGALPDGVVTVSPSGNYRKWDGTEWVLDEEAEKLALMLEAKSRKATLMQVATDAIAPLQDAQDLDIATGEEKEKLTEWKAYRIALNRIDITSAHDIEWPVSPV